MAWKYIEIGDKKAATKIINELKRKNVESAHGLMAQSWLADIYLFQGEYEKFEKCLQTAYSGLTQLAVDDFIKHRKERMLGTVCENKNDYKDAIHHYKAALHESPD